MAGVAAGSFVWRRSYFFFATFFVFLAVFFTALLVAFLTAFFAFLAFLAMLPSDSVEMA